tara:strand:+ start:563 stop:826 length:264 start_codon:yes stop_codon:yes gene_type:complete
MIKIVNIFFLIIILSFSISIFKYYLSNKNVEDINYKKNKIDQILKVETSNLLKLKSDTNDVIEYSSVFSEEIKKEKPRNFWNLFKSK